MPQKKNPDAAELLRAKAPRITAHLAAMHGVMHGLPLTYNKDMQEDKEHLFDAVDTLELVLAAAQGMLSTISFRRERLAGAAGDEFLAATDVADYLVKRGLPFRSSHHVVGGLVRLAVGSGRTLSRADPRGARRPHRRCSTPTASTRCSRTAPGSSPRRPAAAPARRRCATSSRTPVRRSSAPAADVTVEAGPFYAGPCSRSPRHLIGCVVTHGECSGVIVETEAYHDSEPACHAFVGLTPRTRDAVRAARARLRLPVLRRPRDAQRRLRAAGRRRRGADPGARAADGHSS